MALPFGKSTTFGILTTNKIIGDLNMEIKEKKLDEFLEDDLEETDNSKRIVENDGLIERTTLIEKKLIVEDGRQLLTEELPITHSQIL